MFDEVIREIREMWARRTTRYDGEFFSMPAAQRAAQAGAPSRTRRCGSRPATRARSRRPAAAGPRRAVLHHRQPGDARAADRDLQERHRRRRAGRRVRQRQHHGHEPDALPGGRQTGPDIASDMASGYHNSLLFRYLDTFPARRASRPGPSCCPSPRRPRSTQRIEARQRGIGTPDEVPGRADLRATSAPTSSSSGCSRRRCRSTSPSKPARFRRDVIPASTRTRSTAPRPSARPKLSPQPA